MAAALVPRFFSGVFVAAAILCPAQGSVYAQSGVQRYDSAGVEIVVSQLSAGDTLPRWVVSSAPVVTIGTVMGAPMTVLSVVRAGTVLPGGRIVLTNANPQEGRVYAADGSPEGRIGREGDGPGEFQGRLHRVVPRGEDSVTFSHSVFNALVYHVNGEFGRAIPGPLDAGLSARFARWISGARFLVAIPTGESSRNDRGAVQPLTRLFVWSATDREQRDLGIYPGVEFEQAEASVPLRVPFGRSHARALCSDRIYLGDNARYSIDVFDLAGRKERIVRREGVRPMVLSDADREEARARLLDSPVLRAPLPPDIRERVRARAESLPLPEEHPAFTELICDGEGYLWVALPAHADARTVDWEVFDREGVFRATVELPRVDRVLDIGDDHVLSVRTDQLGVEYVELRTLTRR